MIISNMMAAGLRIIAAPGMRLFKMAKEPADGVNQPFFRNQMPGIVSNLEKRA
jgi:hypothetical protein